MKYFFFILSYLTTTLSFSQKSETFEYFKTILNEHNMQFMMPDNYSEIAVKENNDLAYYYAIKHDSLKMEIRYTYFSIKDALETNKTRIGVQTDPNKMYIALTSTNQLNLSGGRKNKVTRFAPNAVQGEFNADDGGSTFIILNSEFGKGYKNCVMVVLHKKNIVDAYVLFLFDDSEVYQNYSEESFYSLTFK